MQSIRTAKEAGLTVCDSSGSIAKINREIQTKEKST